MKRDIIFSDSTIWNVRIKDEIKSIDFINYKVCYCFCQPPKKAILQRNDYVGKAVRTCSLYSKISKGCGFYYYPP